MSKFLLSVHVLAAILAVGPVAVAASMFPAAARRAAGGGDVTTVTVLHRICRVYALVAVAVPVFGLGVAGTMHVMGDPWLIVSIGLTAVAAAVLAFVVLPGQRRLLGGPAQQETLRGQAARLGMTTGVFNLLWAAVTVLMILRPGSSTGA